MEKTRVLITGMAGFIGFHLASKLLQNPGYHLTGFDNINDYYDIRLKYDRLSELGFDTGEVKQGNLCSSKKHSSLQFIKLELEHKSEVDDLFARHNFDIVIHLAAQAGVRHSLKNPYVYVNSNIVGFLNILEACRNTGVKHLVYASSSSVYGQDTPVPFSEKAETSHPVSLYAATKKSNELMAYTYSHLYQLPVTGLRFFTVYGPWGRPDMSPMLFAHAIQNNQPIKVFNQGNMRRDFTYVDDIVDGIARVVKTTPEGYALYNIGNSRPVALMDFITLMEENIGKQAIKELLPMQPGDVYETYADTSALTAATAYQPSTPLELGIKKFLEWYMRYYPVSAQ